MGTSNYIEPMKAREPLQSKASWLTDLTKPNKLRKSAQGAAASKKMLESIPIVGAKN